MPSKTVALTLPRGNKDAKLHYLAHSIRAERVVYELQFLHRVRDLKWLAQYPNWATSDEAVSYYSQLPTAARALADSLIGTELDILLAAPSRRRDADPFLASIKQRFPHAKDLTGSVHRVRDLSAGTQPGAIQFIGNIALTYGAGLADFRNVLIVDDVFSSGTTASAITFRLEQLGLPQDATVTIAVPLLAAA